MPLTVAFAKSWGGDLVVQGTAAPARIEVKNRGERGVDVPLVLVDEAPSGKELRRMLANHPIAVAAGGMREESFDLVAWGALGEPGCHRVRVEATSAAGPVFSETIAIDVEAAVYVDGAIQAEPLPGGVQLGVLGRHQRGVFARTRMISMVADHVLAGVQRELPESARRPTLPPGTGMLPMGWDVIWLEHESMVVASFLHAIAPEVVALPGRPVEVLGSYRDDRQRLTAALWVEGKGGAELVLVEVAAHNAAAPRSKVLWSRALDEIGQVRSGVASLDPRRGPPAVALVGTTGAAVRVAFSQVTKDVAPREFRVLTLDGASLAADSTPALSYDGDPSSVCS